MRTGMATPASVQRSVHIGKQITCRGIEHLAERAGKSSGDKWVDNYLKNLELGFNRMYREAFAKLENRQRTLSHALLRQDRWQNKLTENRKRLEMVEGSITTTTDRHQLEVLRVRKSRIKETIHRNQMELTKATRAVRKARLEVKESEDAGIALGQVPQRE